MIIGLINPTQKISGQALVQAILLTLVVGGISTLVLNQVNESQKMIRAPRVKSEMSQLESKFRSDLTNAASFDCSANPSDLTQCKVTNAFMNSMRRTVTGCHLAPGAGPTCGVLITDRPGTPRQVYDPATNTITVKASIYYTGDDVAVSKRDIDVPVPLQLLNATPFQGTCPSTSPIFKGFDTSGNIQCGTIPADCPSGSYLKFIQPGQGASIFTCVPYATIVSCPGGLIQSFSWNGDGTYSSTCRSPADPSAYFQFSPPPDNGATGFCPPAQCPPLPSIPPTTTTTVATTTTTLGTTTTTSSGPTTTTTTPLPTTTTTNTGDCTYAHPTYWDGFIRGCAEGGPAAPHVTLPVANGEIVDVEAHYCYYGSCYGDLRYKCVNGNIIILSKECYSGERP